MINFIRRIFGVRKQRITGSPKHSSLCREISPDAKYNPFGDYERIRLTLKRDASGIESRAWHLVGRIGVTDKQISVRDAHDILEMMFFRESVRRELI